MNHHYDSIRRVLKIIKQILVIVGLLVKIIREFL